MKKTLANDKVFTDAITAAYGNLDEYVIKTTSNYLILENGMMYLFRKPNVETRFCFGYGQNGISTEEESDAAFAACKAMNEKTAFVNANMEHFREFDEYFEEVKEHGKIYAFVTGNRDNICTFFSDNDVWKMRNYYGPKAEKAYILTDKDIANLKKMVEEEKTKFTKRLETYWKRFGNTKLHTWTYLVD